jgi:hypothetical protein
MEMADKKTILVAFSLDHHLDFVHVRLAFGHQYQGSKDFGRVQVPGVFW